MIAQNDTYAYVPQNQIDEWVFLGQFPVLKMKGLKNCNFIVDH